MISWCTLSHEYFEELLQLNIVLSMSYLLVIFSMEEYIRSNEITFPRTLRPYLSWWFGVLACYSGVSTFYLLPTATSLMLDALRLTTTYRVYDWREDPSLCVSMLAFYISKIIEFGDTIVLLFLNRRIILLQWYHHLTTMWYVFYGLFRRSYTSFWFMYINTAVHMLMYTYYFFQFRERKYITIRPHHITYAQIFQMVIGTGIVLHDIFCVNQKPKSFVRNNTHHTLLTSPDIFGLGLYLSFLCLFLRFFSRRYHHQKLS